MMDVRDCVWLCISSITPWLLRRINAILVKGVVCRSTSVSPRWSPRYLASKIPCSLNGPSVSEIDLLAFNHHAAAPVYSLGR